jgi:transposase
VVTWRRAQIVLLSAQGMDVAAIAKVTFASPDRVRDVIHNFDTDGSDSLRPRYSGGRIPKFDPAQRARIKQVALGRPTDHGLPFSTWSLTKLAEHLVTSTFTPVHSRAGLRCSGRANHRDQVTPPHLPSGNVGGGPLPGRDFSGGSTWASEPGSSAKPQPQPKGDPS